MLHRLALKSGVEIITNATVATVQPPISDEPDETPSSQSELDPTKPTVTLTTGEVYQGDLVVGADGHRGMVRDVIEEIPRAPPGGKVIYNGILPVETLQSNELLRDILEIQIPIWMGSGYYGIGKSSPRTLDGCELTPSPWLCRCFVQHFLSCVRSLSII